MRVFIFCFVFIGLAHGAAVDNVSRDCGVPNLQQDMKCFMQLLSFLKNNFLIILQDTAKAQEFQNSCNDLQNCYTSLQCRQNDPGVMDLSRKMNTYCDSMYYMSTDFADCNKKLEKKNSRCMRNYFPAADRSCSNIFGENDCVKQEIVETCGQRDWVGFRDHVINLLEVGYQNCNFDQYRNL